VRAIQSSFDFHLRTPKTRAHFFAWHAPAVAIPADGVIVGDPRARLEFPPGAVLDATVDVHCAGCEVLR